MDLHEPIMQKLNIKLHDTLKFGQPLKEIHKNTEKCRNTPFGIPKLFHVREIKLYQEIIS